MKKARLREITWFGQVTTIKSYTEPESKPSEASTAHILAVPLYCLLMTEGGFSLLSFPHLKRRVY